MNPNDIFIKNDNHKTNNYTSLKFNDDNVLDVSFSQTEHNFIKGGRKQNPYNKIQNNVPELIFTPSDSSYKMKGGKIENNVLELSFTPTETSFSNKYQKPNKVGGKIENNVLELSFTPTETSFSNKYQKPNKVGGKIENNVLELSFTPTESSFSNKYQKPQLNGGKIENNVLELSFTPEKTNNTDNTASNTTEYFNKLASKIVNNISTTQKGGFNVETNHTNSTDFFLSSDTIQQINQDGGSNFNKQFIKHLKRAVDNSEDSTPTEVKAKRTPFKSVDTSTDTDDLEDELFSDSDSEDEESDDILNNTTSDDDLEDEESEDEDEEINKLHGKVKTKKNKHFVVTESDDSDGSDSIKIYSKLNINSSRSKNKKLMSDSSSNSDSYSDTSNYQVSESISSPKLMSYRSINKNNLINNQSKGSRRIN
jgi:hypothetical protein